MHGSPPPTTTTTRFQWKLTTAGHFDIESFDDVVSIVHTAAQHVSALLCWLVVVVGWLVGSELDGWVGGGGGAAAAVWFCADGGRSNNNLARAVRSLRLLAVN